MAVINNAAKGLFAEAERLAHGNNRPALTLVAAHIALRRGLIRKDLDYGDLADVEGFLRESGSNLHMVAIPRTTDMMGDRPKAARSWLRPEDARQLEEPSYFAITADSVNRADFAYGQQGVTVAENLRRLSYAGLPVLGNTKKFEDYLLNFVPPFVS